MAVLLVDFEAVEEAAAEGRGGGRRSGRSEGIGAAGPAVVAAGGAQAVDDVAEDLAAVAADVVGRGARA